MYLLLSIFSLCYQDEVDKFVQALRGIGVNVWYDKDEVGFIVIEHLPYACMLVYFGKPSNLLADSTTIKKSLEALFIIFVLLEIDVFLMP